MKIKKSFITNSSSASFIINIYSDIYNDLDNFKEFFKYCLNDNYLISLEYRYKKEELTWIKDHIDDIIGSIKRVGPYHFEVEDFTAMLNDVIEDLPKWLTSLLILKAQGKLFPEIKEITFRVEEG